MSNTAILIAFAILIAVTQFVELHVTPRLYPPTYAKIIAWVFTGCVVAGMFWLPFQTFTGFERVLLIVWILPGAIGMIFGYGQLYSLRRAAVSEEHYESLRAGIEKINP